MTQVVQDALLAPLVAELNAVDGDVRAMQTTLGATELGRAAPHGGWTVGQIFEHLIVSNTLYFEAMEQAIAGGRAAGASATWRPSFLGRWLVNSLSPRSTRRVPAPRIFQPGPEPRANVVEALLQSHDRYRALVRTAAGIDLARTRVTSPVSPLIRVNLGDAFRITVVHEQRHLQQIRRILEQS